MKDAFIGYPSEPVELVDNITAGISAFRDWNTPTRLYPWNELGGASSQIIAEVLEKIRQTELSFFDITIPNQNVFYEIGFATGLGKPIFLLLNNSLKGAMKQQLGLGIFDTQRLKLYRNGTDLANIIRDASVPYLQSRTRLNSDSRQPLFFLHHKEKIEFATSYFSCVKSQKMGLRSFDPEEDTRLPLDRAFREISTSAGIFLSLLPPTIKDSDEHNLRSFLLAGIADACNIPRVILKYGEFDTAFDLRDGVIVAKDRQIIQDSVFGLLPFIHEYQQTQNEPVRTVAKSHLMNLSLGATAAENEMNSLDDYFLETREFRRTLRGEARLVVGRKGVGKTAIFWQVRNRLRANRANSVLDLRPDGYQLRKLSEIIEEKFSEATHSHTMTVFWEYVLYLELAHKILDDDRASYGRDHRLIDKYSSLRDAYENVDEFREGDFSERLLRLIGRLRQELNAELDDVSGKILTTPKITELIYKTDFPKLRETIIEYLKEKNKTYILVDNLDRGWSTSGVTESDIRIVQCLIDAGRRIERTVQKENVSLSTTVFLRDDVYEWLVSEVGDRGKDSTVRVLWREPELLHQLIQLRLDVGSLELSIDPSLKWSDISTGTIDSQDIFDFLIHHSLWRPRSLLDLIELCLSNASLAGRSKIEPEDAQQAAKTYSTDMLRDLNFEVRDVFPEADKIIYSYAQESSRLDQRKVERIAKKQLKDDEQSKKFVEMMLWFGFFGIVGQNNQESYIFDHGYDLDLLISHAGRADNPILCIHSLFRHALSIHSDLLF